MNGIREAVGYLAGKQNNRERRSGFRAFHEEVAANGRKAEKSGRDERYSRGGCIPPGGIFQKNYGRKCDFRKSTRNPLGEVSRIPSDLMRITIWGGTGSSMTTRIYGRFLRISQNTRKSDFTYPSPFTGKNAYFAKTPVIASTITKFQTGKHTRNHINDHEISNRKKPSRPTAHLFRNYSPM